MNRNGTEEEQGEPQEDEISEKLPLKNHLARLDFFARQIQEELEFSKKIKSQIRASLVATSQINSDLFQDLNNFINNETQRLQQELIEQSELQTEQHLFLKSQTDSINADRIKLQQNAIVLQNRVEEVEKEFGFI